MCALSCSHVNGCISASEAAFESPNQTETGTAFKLIHTLIHISLFSRGFDAGFDAQSQFCLILFSFIWHLYWGSDMRKAGSKSYNVVLYV